MRPSTNNWEIWNLGINEAKIRQDWHKTLFEFAKSMNKHHYYLIFNIEFRLQDSSISGDLYNYHVVQYYLYLQKEIVEFVKWTNQLLDGSVHLNESLWKNLPNYGFVTGKVRQNDPTSNESRRNKLLPPTSIPHEVISWTRVHIHKGQTALPVRHREDCGRLGADGLSGGERLYTAPTKHAYKQRRAAATVQDVYECASNFRRYVKL